MIYYAFGLKYRVLIQRDNADYAIVGLEFRIRGGLRIQEAAA